VGRTVLTDRLAALGGSFEDQHDQVIPQVSCGDRLVEPLCRSCAVTPPAVRPAADHVGAIDDKHAHAASLRARCCQAGDVCNAFRCHTLTRCVVSVVTAKSDEEDDVMRVFVAGGSGVIGRRLVPQMVSRGHQVTATTTSRDKLELLEQLGAEGVVMDGLDAAAVGEAVAAARPDVIVNQMTALSEAHAGKPNLRKADRFFAATNRLRREGIDHLLAAAEATGVLHVVAQSHASMNGLRSGGWVKTEEDPLELLEGTKAVNHLEDVVVRAGGAALRYGAFYGPGAWDDQLRFVRKRLIPLVGQGTGYTSWVHIDDAASATVVAVEQKSRGVFNIVDDEPAPASEWLPWLAECAGAKPPRRAPARLVRLLAGEMVVGMMTEGRGFSNAKAKRELGWELRYPSWRQGFTEELA
jgi:nucleoside-diphosphate-sugar epimerase